MDADLYPMLMGAVAMASLVATLFFCASGRTRAIRCSCSSPQRLHSTR